MTGKREKGYFCFKWNRAHAFKASTDLSGEDYGSGEVRVYSGQLNHDLSPRNRFLFCLRGLQ